MLLIIAALFIVIAIFMFIQKVILKRRLEQGLGRRVKDSELTSINAWMATDSKGGDKEPNDPNH